MLAKVVPPVISSLSHPSGQKSTGGQGHCPVLQDLCASSWGLNSKNPNVEEPSNLRTLNSQPPLQLSNGETAVEGKGSVEEPQLNPKWALL